MGVGYQHGGGEQAGMRKQRHVLCERPHEEAQLVEDLW